MAGFFSPPPWNSGNPNMPPSQAQQQAMSSQSLYQLAQQQNAQMHQALNSQRLGKFQMPPPPSFKNPNKRHQVLTEQRKHIGELNVEIADLKERLAKAEAKSKKWYHRFMKANHDTR